MSDAGPNRENAQRREEAFWVILTSKTGFYRSRSLFESEMGNDRQRLCSGGFGWEGDGVCVYVCVV